MGTYVAAECDITKDCDDFVRDSRRADGRSDDDVHTLLRVGLKLVEDREYLSIPQIQRLNERGKEKWTLHSVRK